MEEIEKAKRIIERAQNISLLPSPDFREDSFPATLALLYSLKKLGKNVNLIAENYPERFKFLVKKLPHFPQTDFLISIKEVGTKVSQLFYEKTENGLNLFLKTDGDELKKENIDFQPLDFSNVLITVGIESLNLVKKILRKKPKFLINIDNQFKNENYGQINLIEEGVDFGEIISKFGASPPTGTVPSENSLRLFGKVLSKINFSGEKNLGWVSLEKNDFLATNSCPLKLRFTLSQLSSSLSPFQNFLVLWQSKNSPALVRGVFYSQNKEYVQKILENFEGDKKGNGVLFSTKSSDFQKVKDKIISFI